MAVCPSCHELNPEAGAACPRCDGYYYVPEESVSDHKSDPLVGRLTADKYVILGLISEGGMGAVYRALQLPVEREVAFKVLRTELKDSNNGRDRFIREARAVSRLNHANIITLYDFGFDQGKHPYMVMEYAPGKSLAKWLKTENVTTDRVLRVTAQILSALTEAHSHGIVHRDLKPENMIISPRANDPDRVKLLDFGIARMINENSTRGITREGEVFGTPHYMAPEQAQGRKDIGPTADMYAVGIMMWEMLSGDCPFDAPTPLAVLFMHINDPIPPLKPRDTVELVPGLQELIARATAKDPAERYQSAAEMMNDVLTLYAAAGGQTGVFGEPSQEFALSDTAMSGLQAIGSPAPGRPQFTTATGTPVPADHPHFGAGNVGSGVHVHDPEPSHTADQPFDDAAANDNKKLGVIAAVLFMTALCVAAVGFMLAQDPEADTTEPEVPVATAVEPPQIAVTDTVEPPEVEPAEIEPVVEPDAGIAEAEVDAGSEAEKPTEVAEKEPVKRVEKAAPKVVSKPKVEKTKTVAKSTPKEETKPKEEPKKTKTSPAKFAPAAVRWDK